MPRRHGYRQLALMKQKLYNKVLSQRDFPAFSVMFNAGIESVLPDILSNVPVPAGINLNYGVTFASIIVSLINAFNNFYSSAGSQLRLTFSTSTGGTQIIYSLLNTYDTYVSQCSELLVGAVFDETYFDLSVYYPDDYAQAQNETCQQLEQNIIKQSLTLNIAPDTLGIAVSPLNSEDLILISALQGTAIESYAKSHGMTLEQYIASLPDLSRYALEFLSLLNSSIDGGIALDVSWFDRSEFAATLENGYQLGNGLIVQTFANVLGFILDVTPLDFGILMPEFKTPPSEDDLIALLSAERTVVSIFGQLFLAHLQDPSLGGQNLSYSAQAEYYAEAYAMFLQIIEMVKRRYANVWYQKMIAAAISQIARYTYTANLSYTGAARTIPLEQRLPDLIAQWKSWGIREEDINYILQIGNLLQAGSALQSQRKLAQKKQYVKTYKPLFYRNINS